MVALQFCYIKTRVILILNEIQIIKHKYQQGRMTDCIVGVPITNHYPITNQ